MNWVSSRFLSNIQLIQNRCKNTLLRHCCWRKMLNIESSSILLMTFHFIVLCFFCTHSFEGIEFAYWLKPDQTNDAIKLELGIDVWNFAFVSLTMAGWFTKGQNFIHMTKQSRSFRQQILAFLPWSKYKKEDLHWWGDAIFNVLNTGKKRPVFVQFQVCFLTVGSVATQTALKIMSNNVGNVRNVER